MANVLTATGSLPGFLCTAPSEATLEQLVFVTKMRWRIERDYQELKQEFGLTHYEGRGWRGFHHHATLCIAAYAFLVTERLRQDSSKKTALDQKRLPYPKLHPSRQPDGYSATCLTRFRRCDYSSPARSPAGFRGVRVAGMSSYSCDTVRLLVSMDRSASRGAFVSPTLHTP
jgi:hypothetical protein